MAEQKMIVVDKPATQASIDQFMQGEAYQPGGQHDMVGKGMGSGTQEELPRTVNPAGSETMLERESVYVQGTQPGEQEGVAQVATEQPSQDFKKLYGESENEKGKWRRTADEAIQLVEQLRAENTAMQAAFGQQSNATYAAPANANYSGAYVQQQPVQQEQVPQTYFPGREGADVAEIKDIDLIARGVVAELEAIKQQQVALGQAQLNAQKASVGIDAVTEQRLHGTHPWLANMYDGPQKIQAMVDILRSQKQPQATQPAAPTPQNITQGAANAAAPAVRRVTYVESGTGNTTSESEVPLKVRVEQELAEAKRKEGAFGMRKVLEKYGMGQVNDFGPGYLTR